MNNPKIAISINLLVALQRYQDLYSGIKDYSKKHTNWKVVWDHFPEYKLQQSQKKPYYDGIIGRIKKVTYEEASRLKIPMVNTWVGNDLEHLPAVLPDMKEAGFVAAKHLLNRGFRNFVNIDNRKDKASSAFYEGVLAALKPHKIPLKRYLINRTTGENGKQWVKFCNDFSDWAKDWQFPLAICSSTSCFGPNITSRCLENNLRVPEDVAFISAINDHAYCERHSPKTSSVDVNLEKIGYEAARMLHRQMKGEVLEENRIFIPLTGVVARESTDTFAIDDKNVKMAMRFIANNINEHIDVSDIVEAVPISRRTLELRFSSTIGHSIKDEINRLRVISLKRLLLESDMNLNQLSQQSGFSTAKHMTRVFQKCTGMSPKEYRDAIENNEL